MKMLMKSHPTISFFVLAYVISWTLFFPAVAVSQGWLSGNSSITEVITMFGNYGPLIAALIVTAALEGRTGIRALLARLRPGVKNRIWYFAVLIPAGILLVSLIIGDMLGLPHDAFPLTSLLLIPPYFLVIFFNAGIAEEIGWRGFALPHLQQQHNALESSLLLGVVWAGWHIPAFLMAGNYHQGMSLPLFVVDALALSILLTWVTNGSGSLLIPVLMHTVINTSLGFIPLVAVGDLTVNRFVTWAVVLVVIALAGAKRLGGHSAPSAAHPVA
ncbi:MAG: type II CAAX endopeptidase family protein [Anaerolineae bacterium]